MDPPLRSAGVETVRSEQGFFAQAGPFYGALSGLENLDTWKLPSGKLT